MQVPIVQSRARLNTGPANVPISAGVVRGIATDMTGAGDALIRAGLQGIEREQTRAEKEQRARDAVESMKATTAATKALNDATYEIEQSGDFRGGLDRYDKAAGGLAGLGAGIKDPVKKAQLDAHIAYLTESNRATLRRNLFKLEADDGIATLDDNLDTLSKAAAAAPNAAARMKHESAAAANIKQLADAGYITQKQKVDLYQKFKGKISATEAERDVGADPAGFLALARDPRNYDALDPERRERLITRAEAKVMHREQQAVTAADRAEARAERQLRQIQQANDAKLTAEILSDNPPSVETIADLARSQQISPEAARTGVALIKTTGDQADDPRVLLEIENRLYRDGEDVNSLITSGAAKGGGLSKTTASRLLKENEDRKKASPLNAAQRDDLDTVATILQADQLKFAFNDDVAQRWGLARREFMDRVKKGEDSRDVSNELISKYQRTITPMPNSVIGDMPKSHADLDAAALRLKTLRDNGLLSAEQYAKEAAQLMAIGLTLAPAPATRGKGKPAAKGGGAKVVGE